MGLLSVLVREPADERWCWGMLDHKAECQQDGGHVSCRDLDGVSEWVFAGVQQDPENQDNEGAYHYPSSQGPAETSVQNHVGKWYPVWASDVFQEKPGAEHHCTRHVLCAAKSLSLWQTQYICSVFLHHSINKASGDKARALESSSWAGSRGWQWVTPATYGNWLSKGLSEALLVCNEWFLVQHIS